MLQLGKVPLFISFLTLFSKAAGLNEFPRLDFVVARGDSYDDLKVGRQPEITKSYYDKRDDVIFNLTSRNTFYSAEIEIGGQKLSVMLDTGSSDLWLMSSDVVCVDKASLGTSSLRILKRRITGGDSPLLELRNSLKENLAKGKRDDGEITLSNGNIYLTTKTCTSFGSFNTGSSGFNVNSSAPEFYIHYADNSESDGVWGYDDVTIGGVKIPLFSFAVAELATSQVGILGIGLVNNEVTYTPLGTDVGYTYLNLPAKMKSEGIIARNAYSLFLSSDKGTVLFGALDQAKIDGNLTSFPLVNAMSNYGYSEPSRFTIVLSGISVSIGGTSIAVSGNPYAVHLDSGATYTHVSPVVFQNILTALRGTYDSSSGVGFVPCPKDLNVKMDFEFSGITFSVPLASMLFEADDMCALGILPTSGDDNVFSLGDNFLRYVYAVYDADSMEMALANVKDTSDSDLVSISAAVGTQAPKYSQTDIMTVYDTDISIQLALVYSTGKGLPGSSASSVSLQPSLGSTDSSSSKSTASGSTTSESAKSSGSTSKTSSFPFTMWLTSVLAAFFLLI